MRISLLFKVDSQSFHAPKINNQTDTYDAEYEASIRRSDANLLYYLDRLITECYPNEWGIIQELTDLEDSLIEESLLPTSSHEYDFLCDENRSTKQMLAQLLIKIYQALGKVENMSEVEYQNCLQEWELPEDLGIIDSKDLFIQKVLKLLDTPEWKRIQSLTFRYKA